MTVRSLSLQEFRNYSRIEQVFSPALNVVVGDNAQGKTSILEAIYLLATGKSFRGSLDLELIRWDASAAHVSGQVLRQKTHDVELEVLLSQTARKSLVVNTLRATRTQDFIGQLKAVAFSTADLDTLRGEPGRRRRFLDLEISQMSPGYCHTLGIYRKVMEQRNRLLKQLGPGIQSPLSQEHREAWDEQLVQHGSRLVARRRQFVTRLEAFAQPIHARLSEERERLSLVYQSSFSLPAGEAEGKEEVEAISTAFRRELAGVRVEETRRQVSLVGPHRDDLTVLINGRDVRTYGSQGQQRTAALSLKLAELELIQDLTGEAPVCLLDDVFSELDEHRRSHLFEVTLEACQGFLTTTDLDLVPAPMRRRAQVFRVEGGVLHTA